MSLALMLVMVMETELLSADSSQTLSGAQSPSHGLISYLCITAGKLWHPGGCSDPSKLPIAVPERESGRPPSVDPAQRVVMCAGTGVSRLPDGGHCACPFLPLGSGTNHADRPLSLAWPSPSAVRFLAYRFAGWVSGTLLMPEWGRGSINLTYLTIPISHMYPCEKRMMCSANSDRNWFRGATGAWEIQRFCNDTACALSCLGPLAPTPPMSPSSEVLLVSFGH